MLSIQRLTEENFFNMQSTWNELLSASMADSFFLSWEWLSEWWKHFGKGKELFVLAVRDSDGICGIAPLLRENRLYFKHLPVSRIGFLGTHMVDSDYLDFIAAPGREDDVTQVIMNYIHGAPFRWDVLDLTDIRENSATLNFVKHYKKLPSHMIKERMGEICPYLTLPQNSTMYHSALSSNMRYNINRRTKNLHKFFKGNIMLWEHDGAEDLKTLQNILRQLFFLHRSRWTSVGMQTKFSLVQVENFHMSVLPLLMARGAIRLSSLTADGNILAIIYGFHHGRKYYFYQSGFDPAYFQLSPGLVLMNFSIEQAIERGTEEFDFLRGEEEYKAKFTKTFRRTHNIEIWKNSLKKGYLNRLRSLRKALSTLKKRETS